MHRRGKEKLLKVLDEDPTNVHALMHLIQLALHNAEVGLTDLQAFAWLHTLEEVCIHKCHLEEALKRTYNAVIQWNSKRKVGAEAALGYLRKVGARSHTHRQTPPP